MVSGVQNVSFLGEIQTIDGKKVLVLNPTNRKEDLPEDTLELSTKKEKKNENGFLNTTCKTISEGVKSFVSKTVDGFVKAGSEIVLDKAIGKITKK
ncbi:hypothetical protein IKE67_08050 [bacterium]|nr:hypothetical protein [bacterium]